MQIQNKDDQPHFKEQSLKIVFSKNNNETLSNKVNEN